MVHRVNAPIETPPETTSEQTNDQPQAHEASADEGLILGKFKDQAALEQAYTNLEQRLGQGGGAQSTEETQEPTEQAAPPTQEGLAIETPEPEATEFDFTPYYETFTNTGELTDEQYTELEKAGYPRHLVDGYITGMKATAEQQAQTVFEKFGGRDEYAKAAQWASQSMTEEWLERFNDDVNSGDMRRVNFATQALRAAYLSDNGQAPQATLSGATGTGGGATPFRSLEEMEAAMRDPRYKSGDPGFHAEVDARLAASPNIFS